MYTRYANASNNTPSYTRISPPPKPSTKQLPKRSSTSYLRRGLQPMLIVVTSLEQTVVLPLQFSLDNIVLKQVSLHLTKISKQALVFLKLDFF